MQIILKEDVQGLGYKDDVVEVKNGYGRNYLIPQGKAVIATPSALKVLAENQRQRAHKPRSKRMPKLLPPHSKAYRSQSAPRPAQPVQSTVRSTLSRSPKLSKNSVTMWIAVRS